MAINNLGTGLRPGVCTSLSRPTTPYEGQMVYLTDTDLLQIWNGSAWKTLAAAAPAQGTVLQVVSNSTSALESVNNATFKDTLLTVTITPQSNTSKIFVVINQHFFVDTASGDPTVRLVRDSTILQRQSAAIFTSGGTIASNVSFMYLDSPATTSATIYKTTFARTGGSGIVYAQPNTNPSNITVFEISA